MVHLRGQDVEEPGLLGFASDGSESDLEVVLRKFPERKAEFVEIEEEIPLSSEFPNTIIVAGLPKINREKYDMLKGVVTQLIRKELTRKQVLNCDAESDEDTFTVDMPIVTVDIPSNTGDMPISEDPVGQQPNKETTLGFCYVIFKEGYVADQAAKILSHVNIGSHHSFRTCRMDDFETAITETEYKSAEQVGFSRENQRDWLSDPLGREQFIFRSRAQTYIMAHDAIERQPEEVVPSDSRLGRSILWSPRGSYLVAFHKRGIWLRSNYDFVKTVSFSHPGVKCILFSPNEEYLITWDGGNNRIETDKSLIVWQVLTKKMLRAFPTPRHSLSGVSSDEGPAWPFMLFSHDSKYLAMRRERDLVVYELPTMALLEEPSSSSTSNSSSPSSTSEMRNRSPLNYAIETFQWSPSALLLSLWIPESGDSPGRLLLVHIPSRQEIASKNVFNVKNVWIHWQARGDFMALRTVIARKKGKKTKTETTQIEVFKVREKSIPVDTISLEGGYVRDLFWEKGPTATRFATLDVDDGSTCQTIKFYQVPTKGSKRDTELVAAVSVPMTINAFEWSPSGQYFVAAAKGSDGSLLFGCLNEQNKVEILCRDDYPDLTDIMYSPSGRYVTTAVLVPPDSTCAWQYGMSAGFRISSFFGRLQYRYSNEQCQQFMWRPRPPSLLSPEKIEDVHRKLKEYSKKYDAQDDARRLLKKQALKEESSVEMNEFLNKLAAARELIAAHPSYSEWQESWKRFDSTMRWEESVVVEEEILEISREAVTKKD